MMVPPEAPGTAPVSSSNVPATAALSTLSLHDALPISKERGLAPAPCRATIVRARSPGVPTSRSEEHTSELQSRRDLVCRLLLEKKKLTLTLTNSAGNQAQSGIKFTYTLPAKGVVDAPP